MDNYTNICCQILRLQRRLFNWQSRHEAGRRLAYLGREPGIAVAAAGHGQQLHVVKPVLLLLLADAGEGGGADADALGRVLLRRLHDGPARLELLLEHLLQLLALRLDPQLQIPLDLHTHKKNIRKRLMPLTQTQIYISRKDPSRIQGFFFSVVFDA
jgi:hypothetical protein